MRRAGGDVLVAVAAAAAAAGIGAAVMAATGPDVAEPPAEVTVLAAGDIGRCDQQIDEATAQIVRDHPGAPVLALGDLAYDSGTRQEFEECYDPSWGFARDRTYPVPGNHEYYSEGGDPYFDYFGDGAGEHGKGWYSADVGRWHVVALNSNCEHVDCGPGSEQERWLRSDLEATDVRCTLALWHHPRFTSGTGHGSTPIVDALWQALVEHDAELLLSGHEHLYERTAPLDAQGQVDPEDGVRQFVVGTAGGSYHEAGELIEGSQAVVEAEPGVLRMTLEESGYAWEFVTPAGSVQDSGSDRCR